MSLVTRETRGEIALLTIDNPPVNALGRELRADLLAALVAAEADRAVNAIVIAAAGRTFPAGADIREFDRPAEAPGLPDLCDRIEACAKPVIAALHGTVLGGGLELALAAHVRVALSSARLGFPEISLGLLPGAGGTQRAPRLIGAEAALRLMLTGRPVTAAEAQAMGLVDGTVDDGLTEAALSLATEIAAEKRPPSRSRDATAGFAEPAAYEAAIAAARNAPPNPDLPAPSRIVDCVEAALLLPFEAGQAFERAAFEDLLVTPAARGLRHAFLSERRMAKTPEAGLRAPKLEHVGVVGGGRLGAGLAAALLDAGMKVTLVEAGQDALVAALERVADLHEEAVARGRMTAERRDEVWTRLSGTADTSLLAAADMVVEAAPEDDALKQDIFTRLGAIVRQDAVLATTSVAGDVARFARAAGRPGRTLALQLQPAGLAPGQPPRLIEVGVLPETAAEAAAAGLVLAQRLRRPALRCAAVPGLVVGRLRAALQQAAALTVAAGASPYEVDAALAAFGYPQGPFLAEDLAGLDLGWALRRTLAEGRDPEARRSILADQLVELGRLGREAGAGWYAWPGAARHGETDPTVLAEAEAERARLGLAPREIGAAEIARRCLLALIAEAARLVEDGTALRPSDVDMAAVLGLGFPRWRGGPLLSADLMGLLPVRRALATLAPEGPEVWTAPELLADLDRNGRRFADLDAG